MASTNIQRTHASAPTDNKKCTISVWVKRGLLNGTNSSSGIYGGINAAWNAAGNVQIGFMNDKAYCWFKTAGGDRKKQESTRVFRDTNAWYHFVYRIDTTQSTGSDRIRVYCNNEELTSWGSTADPTLNEDISFTTNGYTNYIGKFNWTNGGVNYFDGLMSHFHFCDGYSYAPSEFGETDSTTGEWKIKTAPSVNYGNNGYFILKDGNSLTDQSSNTNNWSTHNGTLTKTEDCPSNVFCTMNPLNHDYASTDTDLGAGNTFVYPRANTNYNYAVSTLAMPKGNGKFYFEAKIIRYDNVACGVGIVDMDYVSELFYENRQIMGASNNTDIGRVILSDSGHSIISGTQNSSYGFGAWADGDIICMACDMENGAFYFRKNGGSWANSGDPTSGSSKTGAIDISATTPWTSSSHWGVWCGDNESNHDRFSFNFGNGNFPSASGSFGSQTYSTTAVSSAGTNASGNGIFEYDVPTGYTALSTKGLNE